MKKHMRPLLALLACLAAPVAASAQHALAPLPDTARLDIFLLVGQSNMAGRGTVEELDRTPHERVWMLDRNARWVPAVEPMHFDKPRVTGVGPGRAFGVALAAHDSTTRIGLVPAAVGGTSIRVWVPGARDAATGTHPYDDALQRARAAMQHGTIRAILWHQGESDGNERNSADYQRRLEELVTRFRRDLGDPDLPFLVGQVGHFPGRARTEFRDEVDRAHRALPGRLPNVAFVSSDGLTDRGDATHFDSPSARRLGERFADAYLRLTATTAAPAKAIALAKDGRTSYVIAIGERTTETERFAASELASYLKRMSGASFTVTSDAPGERAIVLRTDTALATLLTSPDAYTIQARGDNLVLTGASDRAVLYAVYDLLTRLGCRFLAPALDFYAGASELVPSRRSLVYHGTRDVTERPAFAIRKLDVEEGLSHDAASLARIVDWMPKARYNTLQVPLDYGGAGRVRWDTWREALTPELDRRGIDIEVGGHGYQNFLNPEMERGKLFELHPEWFGKDAQCRPSRAEHLVFNTANPEAVAYLIANVIRYVKAHPEIDILDFWPPDGARWAECKEWEKLGTPQDRQARLVNQVAAALREVRPGLRLEMIAYAHAKLPPETVRLDPSVLVDFCPIGQNFDVPIDDPAGSNNALYVDAIRAWRGDFDGDIGLYSYYRKYAWRSLPVQVPHYMQQDMKWYSGVPLQGISTYAEPADWYTYELNHYTLGHLAWNPDVDVDSLIADYAAARYGAAAEPARQALATLEDDFRLRGSIPYSDEDTPEQIAAARAEVGARAAALSTPRASGTLTAAERANVDRLTLMLGFAQRDLRIREARARAAGEAAVAPLVRELVDFLTANGDRGVFLTRKGDLARYTRFYAPAN